MKKLETIWDFNPTEEEKQKIGLGQYKNKEDYFKSRSFSKNNELLYKFELFLVRGKKEEAMKILDQLPRENEDYYFLIDRHLQGLI
jgi:thioredoxin-like negative regulator of GroEL